ncbi:hypothetical protein HG531_003371 [Fusarium graminearum]|nr:hypothetical protein HG531_003371 [Fusarium graminearum]
MVDTDLDLVDDLALGEIQALGDKLCGVLGGIDSQGLGNDKKGLRKLANGELLSGANGTGKLLEVDMKSCLDGTTTGDDAATFKIVGATENARCGRVSLGTLDKDALIVGDALLDNLLGVSKCAEHGGSGSSCNSSKIFLLTSSNAHGTLLDESLKNQVVNTLCCEDNVGTSLEDHLHSVKNHACLASSDLFKLLRVVNSNLDTKLHTLLLQVHVQNSNLGVLNSGRHSLRGNGAVQGVTLNKNGFESALAMSLENVDSLDGVLGLVSVVGGLDSLHSIDDHVGEEL